jgi:hypothetical protein
MGNPSNKRINSDEMNHNKRNKLDIIIQSSKNHPIILLDIQTSIPIFRPHSEIPIVIAKEPSFQITLPDIASKEVYSTYDSNIHSTKFNRPE